MPEEKVYTARKGAQFSDAQAAVFGPAIENLGPSIDTDTVVRDASRPDSPLHSFFEWDDCKAAAKHRKQQARHLLGNLLIRIEKVEMPIRAFHSIQIEKKTRKYLTTVEVMSTEDYRKQIIQKALKEAKRWRETYQNYKELEKIFTVIDSF